MFCIFTHSEALEVTKLAEAIQWLMVNNDLTVNTFVLWSVNDLSREVFIESLLGKAVKI